VIVRKPEKRAGESKLGEPRLELIHLWLPPPEDDEGSVEPVEAAEAPPEADDSHNVVPISRHHSGEVAAVVQPATDVEPPPAALEAVASAPPAVEAVPSAPPPEAPAPADEGDEPPAAAEAPRRRGRPRRHVKRRQVHFHVDPEEDELLLAAARQHGSQQKGLIAALRALQDVARLRVEVDRLKRQSERQQQLLVAARSLLDKP
jgi:hypothetical protein